MLPDSGIVIVFVARLSDCPAESMYGPVGSAADCSVAAGCNVAADRNMADAAELGIVMILESRVTAAVRANSRPSTDAPVVTVMRSEEHTSELQSRFGL